MKHKRLILLFGISVIMCGNMFADYAGATTTQPESTNKSFLTAATFPKVAADAPFVNRMENKVIGYRPYFNRSAFAGITPQEQDELQSMAYRAELERLYLFNNSSRTTYCANYPADSENCPNVTSTDIDTSRPPVDQVSQSIYPVITPSQQPISYSGDLYMTHALTPANITQYNLAKYDGGCTPPEYSDWWSNKILTSGKYMYSNPAFEKFMITAFRKEGGCINDPNDRGGYTCYGCASNGLCSGIDMNNITRETVETLAYNNMYKKYNVDKLPDAFRVYAMWGIWGSGPISGIKIFQSALNTPQTGRIDDATIRAAENYVGDFADAYVSAQNQFYHNIVARDSGQSVFINGWTNSLKLLRPSGCHVMPINPIYR